MGITFLYLIEGMIILNLGSEGEGGMKLTCARRCGMMELLANLKCPNCFSIEAHGTGQDLCDCTLRMTRELRIKWE